MTQKLQRIMIALVIIIGLSLQSCEKEEIKQEITLPIPSEEDKSYIDITAVTSCSPDLLELVIPTVEITLDNGEKYSHILSTSDFRESEEGGEDRVVVIIDGQTTSILESTSINNIAETKMRYDGTWPVKGNVSVSYSLKLDAALEKDSYVFFHNVYLKKEYIILGQVQRINTPKKPMAYKVNKYDVEAYIKKLVSQPDYIEF